METSKPLTESEERYIVRSLVWSQRLAGLEVSEERAQKALRLALSMPLPEIR
ncbi:MAG: hypothetical protein KGL39_44095 [Patescibacteria group bacterium]|nr:hypothetical protein [Patescibacteria group bacterium]